MRVACGVRCDFQKGKWVAKSNLERSCGIESMPTFQFYQGWSKCFDMQGADPNQLKEKVAALK